MRVGRSKENDVVIHGSLVSRRHLELWNHQGHWQLINFGANGTFVEGKPVHQSPVDDGMIIRLGSTGPRLQLRLDFQPEHQTAKDYLTAHPVDP